MHSERRSVGRESEDQDAAVFEEFTWRDVQAVRPTMPLSKGVIGILA